jgi:hypothetical protein
LVKWLFSKLNPAYPGGSFPRVVARATATVPATVGPVKEMPPSTAGGSPVSAGPLLSRRSPESRSPLDEPPEEELVPPEELDGPDELDEPPDDDPDAPDEDPDRVPDEEPEEPPEEDVEGEPEEDPERVPEEEPEEPPEEDVEGEPEEDVDDAPDEELEIEPEDDVDGDPEEDPDAPLEEADAPLEEPLEEASPSPGPSPELSELVPHPTEDAPAHAPIASRPSLTVLPYIVIGPCLSSASPLRGGTLTKWLTHAVPGNSIRNLRWSSAG